MRGNIELRGFYNKGSETLTTGSNFVDPMALRPTWRDAFPKMDLYDGASGCARRLIIKHCSAVCRALIDPSAVNRRSINR